MANNNEPRWAVGLITAPRQKGYYLDQTLQSIIKAGWQDLTIFAEPQSIIPDWYDGYVVRRRKCYGDWTNWATALYELLLSEYEADYFFMVEDDGIFCKNIKQYLNKLLPTIGNFGTLSIYCPGRYHLQDFCGIHDECVGPLTWSTLTVIMSREGVRSFFSDKDVQRHRFENVFPQNIKWGVEVDPCNSVKDAILGLWAQKNALPMYYHTPSLVKHIGMHSTLSRTETTWENLAMDFVGEDFSPEWSNIKIKTKKKVPLL